jgi:hypothetical protein
MVGIADEGDDVVTALGQDLGEAQGNLAVASGNGYSHGLKLRPAGRRGCCGGWLIVTPQSAQLVECGNLFRI